MRDCRVCRFDAMFDDLSVAFAAATLHRGGEETCLRCYARTAGPTPAMPRALRRQLDAILASLEAD